MEKENIVQSCLPEPMNIESIGWIPFLDTWESEYMAHFYAMFNEFGWQAGRYPGLTLEKLLGELEKYGDVSAVKFYEPNSLHNNWDELRSYLKTYSAKSGDYFERDIGGYIQNDYHVRVGGDFYFDVIRAIAVNEGILVAPFKGDPRSIGEARIDSKPSMKRAYGPDIAWVEDAENQLKGLGEFKLPASYIDFISSSDGLMATSYFPETRKEPDFYELGLLSINQIGYLINSHTGDGFWEFYISYETNKGELNIPASIVIGAGDTDTTIVIDFSQPTAGDEFKIFALAGQGTEILDSWDTFTEFMEETFQRSIASICAERRELEQARDDGLWKPIRDRG